MLGLIKPSVRSLPLVACHTLHCPCDFCLPGTGNIFCLPPPGNRTLVRGTRLGAAPPELGVAAPLPPAPFLPPHPRFPPGRACGRVRGKASGVCYISWNTPVFSFGAEGSPSPGESDAKLKIVTKIRERRGPVPRVPRSRPGGPGAAAGPARPARPGF